MPTFEVRFTSGVTRAVWTDPADGDRPTRLNHDDAHPHTYRRATVGQPVTLSAVVDGDVAPLDAALGGNLFTAWFGEVPSLPAPSMSSPVGRSSVVSFTPTHPGHHLVVFLRSSGGRVLVPFEAVGT